MSDASTVGVDAISGHSEAGPDALDVSVLEGSETRPIAALQPRCPAPAALNSLGRRHRMVRGVQRIAN